MIQEFEYYHGVALRSIIVAAPNPVFIERRDEFGRVNTYIINNRVAIHIKHSTKRLAPWQFSFTVDQLKEVLEIALDGKSVWLLFVCGVDGLVGLSLREFIDITEARAGNIASIRVDRERRRQYRIYGNAGQLSNAKARGVAELIQECTLERRE